MSYLPVEQSSDLPVMWRAYSVGITKDNKLVISGAHGARWEDVEFVATCDTYGNSIGSTVSGEMRQRIYQSHVIMPGEMPRRTDLNATRGAAHKRCIMHLESGSCACGVWGYKAPARVQREYLNSSFWNSQRFIDSLEVLCAVRCYGTVLEGEWGYRASNVEIEAMFVPNMTDVFVEIDPTTMKTRFGHDARISFLTIKGGYNRKRLDPQAVYNRLQKDYSCQVIGVADGEAMVRMLDKDHPDPLYKPINSWKAEGEDAP